MKKVWGWLKPKLVWILAGAGLVLGFVVTLLTLGQAKPGRGKLPKRPDLPDPEDVKVPDVNTDFNDKPADDYEEKKADENENPDEDVADLNGRFK